MVMMFAYCHPASADCSGAHCAAMDAKADDYQMLLQQTSKPSARQTAHAALVHHSTGSAAASGERAAHLLATNSSKEKACSKVTGSFCLTGICNDALSAECDSTMGSLTAGQCVCPQFTCFSEGKCQWSVGEIRDAVGSGATNVVDQVTAVAAKVPGLADAAGAMEGVWNTVSGVFGSIFGSGGCSGYVGLCWGQCSNQA
ncbi:unnamed protein product, partial [Symbiodinium natans]